MDVADPSPITRSIAEQARAAVAEADLVLFVVDAKTGITPGDEEVADILRAARRPVFLLANKIDDPARDTDAVEFHRLGLGDPIPLSALHGHGTGDLLDAVVARLPGSGPARVGDEAIRVAILGRPNVGKSSLLNAILGEERVIVSDVPGTTRDAIDTLFERGDRMFVLVDTAGLRRKRRQRQGVEYYSELRALDAAARADVALVLVDAGEGLVDQDLAVADVARKASCSTLVVLSKWDVGQVKVEDVRPADRRAAAPAPRARHRLGEDGPRRPPPARPRRGAVREAHEPHPDPRAEPLPRGAACGPPGPARATGAGSTCSTAPRPGMRPPRFRFFVNDPSLVTRDYGYWVENRAARAVRARGGSRLDRLRETLLGHAHRRSSAAARGERCSRGSWPTAGTR